MAITSHGVGGDALETVVNAAGDLGVQRPPPESRGLRANFLRLTPNIGCVGRVGLGCFLASPALSGLCTKPRRVGCGGPQPSVRRSSCHGPDRRLCQTLSGRPASPTRACVPWSPDCAAGIRASQMTYDLRRLRLAGLIRRLPRSNRYTLTVDGIRIAIFYYQALQPTARIAHRSRSAQGPREVRRR